MKKYGFIYLWYDSKHKRYYIGSHWGTEDDGYICSSSWMKQAFKKRPNDFSRRILVTNIPTKKLMNESEHYWLQMIRDDELGKKYYNLKNHRFGHWAYEDNYSSIGEKISSSPKRAERISKALTGIKRSEETKKRISENTSFRNPEVMQRIVKKRIGKPRSEETKAKIRTKMMGNKNRVKQ